MGFDALMRGVRVLAAIVALLAGSLAGAAAITDRMSLTEAIEAVRDQGFEIVYSSKLVAPWMRVRETPGDPDPHTPLDEALALDPGYGDARINRALLERSRGRIDDARRELRLAARDARSRAKALRQRGGREFEQGRCAAAEEALEEA